MLLRFYSDSRGYLKLDPAQVALGRGVYVCPEPGCIERALRSSSFARSLRRNIARVPAETFIKRCFAEFAAFGERRRRGALSDRRELDMLTGARTPKQGVKVLDEQLRLSGELARLKAEGLKRS